MCEYKNWQIGSNNTNYLLNWQSLSLAPPPLLHINQSVVGMAGWLAQATQISWVKITTIRMKNGVGGWGRSKYQSSWLGVIMMLPSYCFIQRLGYLHPISWNTNALTLLYMLKRAHLYQQNMWQPTYVIWEHHQTLNVCILLPFFIYLCIYIYIFPHFHLKINKSICIM